MLNIRYWRKMRNSTRFNCYWSSRNSSTKIVGCFHIMKSWGLYIRAIIDSWRWIWYAGGYIQGKGDHVLIHDRTIRLSCNIQKWWNKIVNFCFRCIHSIHLKHTNQSDDEDNEKDEKDNNWGDSSTIVVDILLSPYSPEFNIRKKICWFYDTCHFKISSMNQYFI